MKNSTRFRNDAFQRQGGSCYYCNFRMWTVGGDNFPPRYLRRLQCTAEHLVPLSQGGLTNATNIVAACLYCNRTRHKAKRPLDFATFKARVQRRLSSGKWHPHSLFASDQIPR